ncbi:MAG: flagellar basal body L-ring protein FlgH [Kofleriaceae bacterium]
MPATWRLPPAAPRLRRRAQPGALRGAPRGSLPDGQRVVRGQRRATSATILVIRIDERDAASRNAQTDLSTADDATYGVPSALGLVAALGSRFPNVDAANLLTTSSSSRFAGAGSTERNGRVSATLAVRIARVLGNGDLFVEGTKVVMVGAEEQHLYISGVVRRVDVAPDNTVLSSKIADAEIEYSGRGDVSDTQRRGWLSRIIAFLWPF